MSFNLTKHKKESQVAPYEKYLREEDVAPAADDTQPIAEKVLTHREGNKYTTTEDQMESNRSASNDDQPIAEKALEKDEGKYVDHRNDATWLDTTPHAAAVEKLRQDRLASDWKEEKESHWTVSFNDQEQNADLPEWPKMAPQHDKTSLNNDPRRFEGLGDLTKGEKGELTPLHGGITTANADHMAKQIKRGQTVDYDTAIVAILHSADKEKRDLTPIERKSVVALKVARTKALLKHAKSSK